jgi:hypothetical protein
MKLRLWDIRTTVKNERCSPFTETSPGIAAMRKSKSPHPPSSLTTSPTVALMLVPPMLIGSDVLNALALVEQHPLSQIRTSKFSPRLIASTNTEEKQFDVRYEYLGDKKPRRKEYTAPD